MRIILRTAIVGAGCVALVSGLLAGCATSGSAGDPGRFEVAVAENFWGSIVRQIAGADAPVTSIISNPNADPHDYEPTVGDARTIATSQYVIENGLGYDAWVQKLLDANAGSEHTVLNVGELLGLSAGSNPHQWYSPDAVHRFVTRVSADLAKLDPEHRAGYLARGRAYEQSGLREYNRLLADIKKKYAGTAIGASESIVAPWATGLSLRLLTPEPFLEAIAEGNEPTSTDKSKVDAQIEHHEINVFVYNEQNATPDVRRLVEAAEHEHIPVVRVTETLPAHDATFQAWQVRELGALLAALHAAATNHVATNKAGPA